MAAREYGIEISAIDATLVSIEKVLDLPKLRKLAAELEEQAGVPNLWDDPESAQKITSRLSRTQSVISKLESLRQRVSDLPILIELAQSESDTAAAMTDAEAELDATKKAVSELEVQTLLNGDYDDRDCLMTIRSEAGGVEGEQKVGMDKFRADFKTKFNADVQVYAPYVYDAVKVMATAMVTAGSADPAKYLPALKAINYKGVTGNIAFDEKGDIKNGALTLYTYKAGKRDQIAVVR